MHPGVFVQAKQTGSQSEMYTRQRSNYSRQRVPPLQLQVNRSQSWRKIEQQQPMCHANAMVRTKNTRGVQPDGGETWWNMDKPGRFMAGNHDPTNQKWPEVRALGFQKVTSSQRQIKGIIQHAIHSWEGQMGRNTCGPLSGGWWGTVWMLKL